MEQPCKSPYTLLGFLSQSEHRWRSNNCSAEERFDVFRDYAVREINALLWIFLILTTVLLLREVNKLIRLWAKGRNIPGPPCPSFFGHSRLISRAKSGVNLTELLLKSHEKYGSIVRLWLSPTQLLVSLKDPALITEMLIKAEDKLPLTERAFRLAFGRSSLFASSFEEVQKRRETLAFQLNEKLLQRENLIPSKVMDHVMERIDSIMVKGALDCRLISQHMAFSILGATVFGDTFLAWFNATVYEELFMTIAKDACFWASYSFPPFWKRGFWKYQSLCTKLKCLTNDIIEQCRQNYKLFIQMDHKPQDEATICGKGAETEAVLFSGGVMTDDLFLEELNGHLNSIEEPCGNIMGVMFHGCLSTAALVGSILTRLVMQPEIQDKIYSEIMMVHQISPKPESQDIDQMQFLLATIYESARLMPAGPFLQRCSLKQDMRLKNGITVPAGAILVVPVQLVQMDDSSWGSNASEFNPHRFFSEPEKESNSGPVKPLTGAAKELKGIRESKTLLNDPNANAAFLPFGSGARACVGQKYAILAIATLFVSLLRDYEVRLQPGSTKDPKPTMNNCVLQLLPSPNIVFIRRNK